MQVLAVATDFSVRSDRALLRAKLIARRTGARLAILHVVDEDQPPRHVAANKEAALSLLTAATETLQTVDGIAADRHVVVADVPNGILAAADEVGADLNVVGRHRRRLTASPAPPLNAWSGGASPASERGPHQDRGTRPHGISLESHRKTRSDLRRGRLELLDLAGENGGRGKD
ncbi:MAG: universal stress protein [Sphingomonadaceae bacterium]|nr:universal stress protein [Sphingomonadaceae bacterium]